MVKSVTKILTIVFLSILSCFLLFYLMLRSDGVEFFEELQKVTKKYVSETNIEINNQGFINVEKIIQLQLGKKQTEMPKIYLPLSCEWNKNDEIDFEIDVYVDGELWPKDLIDIDTEEDTLGLENFDTSNKELRIIKIEANYPTNQYVKEYKNYSVLSIKDKTYFDKSIVNISLPKKSEEVLLDNWFEIRKNALRKLDDQTYKIDLRLIDSAIGAKIEFVFDSEVVENSKKTNQYYEVKDLIEEYEFTGKEFYNFAFIGIIIDLVCLTILFVIRLANRVKKEYTRDPNEVIEPIFAEVIIDRKLGIKESIMSVLADLIHRGNIECINNQNLVLINEEGLKTYERKIVDLVFEKKERTCSFEKIREYFKKNNEKTAEFYQCFSKLKEIILKNLIDEKVFSKQGEILIKIIRIILILVSANLIYFTFELLSADSTLSINPQYLFMTNVFALFLGIKKENINTKLVEISDAFTQGIKKNFRTKLIIYMLSGLFVLGLFFSIFSIYMHMYIELYILYVLLFILNTFTYIKARTHLYTSKGKETYKKALGLKAYIDDYSLMKERSLDSSIIWDDYLTYAIAFGISNKVTDLLGENIMKTNILLQKIEKILRF